MKTVNISNRCFNCVQAIHDRLNWSKPNPEKKLLLASDYLSNRTAKFLEKFIANNNVFADCKHAEINLKKTFFSGYGNANTIFELKTVVENLHFGCLLVISVLCFFVLHRINCIFFWRHLTNKDECNNCFQDRITGALLIRRCHTIRYDTIVCI